MASKDSSTRQGQQHQQSAGDDAGAAQAGRQSPASQTGGVTQASVPLIDGEEVLIDARPAWSAFSLQIIAAVLIFVGGLAAGDAAVIGGFVFAAFILGYVVYQRRKVRYVVTDRRMMQVMGISSSATSEAWMVDVRGLQTGASFIERFLGHGHITISTDIQGGGLSRFRSGMTFGGVSNYEEIAHIIRQRQNAAKMD
jgi:hypothetical protein